MKSFPIDGVVKAFKQAIEEGKYTDYEESDPLDEIRVLFEDLTYESGGYDVELDGNSVGEKYEYGLMVHEIWCSTDGQWTATGIFYATPFSRSGSYYSDYHYEYGKPYQVELKERTYTVEEWVKVCEK